MPAARSAEEAGPGARRAVSLTTPGAERVHAPVRSVLRAVSAFTAKTVGEEEGPRGGERGPMHIRSRPCAPVPGPRPRGVPAARLVPVPSAGGGGDATWWPAALRCPPAPWPFNGSRAAVWPPWVLSGGHEPTVWWMDSPGGARCLPPACQCFVLDLMSAVRPGRGPVLTVRGSHQPSTAPGPLEPPARGG